MVNLITFFKVMFMLTSISEDSFLRFVQDHRQRLIANNPDGKYALLIAALTTLLNEFKEALDQRNLNQALQESQTKTVDQLIASFKAMISRSHVDITDRWKVDNPIYEKFFPRGPEEYSKANKSNVGGLMNRFIAVCDLYREDLPVGFVTPYKTLKASFDTDRESQLNLIGNTDGNRLNVSHKREALARQTTKNLHTLGSDFLGETNAVNVYFDQSIIRRPATQNGIEPETDVFADAVAPASSVVILHGGFDANSLLHIVNTGSVNLKFYTANMPEDPVSGNALELAPGEEDDIMVSELGADSNLFLMVNNAHATIAGSYEVSIETE